jgi:hypothetical protein
VHVVIGISSTYFCLERDSLSRKSARSGQKGDAVDNFRGVSFDDWLRLIMQVSHSNSCGLYAELLTGNAVLFCSDETRSI